MTIMLKSVVNLELAADLRGMISSTYFVEYKKIVLVQTNPTPIYEQ